jgi:hypothetical protein
MKSHHFLVTIAILTATVGVGILPAAASHAKSWVQDGHYAGYISRDRTAYIGVTVVGNGTKLQLGGTDTGDWCSAAPSLAALDPTGINAYVSEIHSQLPTISISPSGAFSFNGNVTLTPETTGGTLTLAPLPVRISGHFIHVKGRLTHSSETVAAVGTFSAPQICTASTPTTFSLYFS